MHSQLAATRQQAIDQSRDRIVALEANGLLIPDQLMDELDAWISEGQPEAMLFPGPIEIDQQMDYEIEDQQYEANADNDGELDEQAPDEYSEQQIIQQATRQIKELLSDDKTDEHAFTERNPDVPLSLLFEMLAAEVVFSNNLSETIGQVILEAITFGYVIGTGQRVNVRTFPSVS